MLHILQCDPPCHNRRLQLLGRRACSWGAEGWSAQRAREAEDDGGRGTGALRAAYAGDKRTGTKIGRGFLGAATQK